MVKIRLGKKIYIYEYKYTVMYHIKISALLANKEFEADEFREKKPIVVPFCCVKVEI